MTHYASPSKLEKSFILRDFLRFNNKKFQKKCSKKKRVTQGDALFSKCVTLKKLLFLPFSSSDIAKVFQIIIKNDKIKKG